MSMGAVIHMLEIAALLAVTYSIGWVVGYVVHRMAARPAADVVAIPAERLAAVTGGADALVKAPTISEVVDPAAVGPAVSAGDVISATESVPAEAASPPPVTELAAPASPVADQKLVEIAAELAEMAGTTPPEAVSDVVEGTHAQVPAALSPAENPAETPVAEIASPAEVVPEPAIPPPPETIEKRLSRFARFRPKSDPEVEPAPQSAAPVAATLLAAPSTRPGEAWSGDIRGRAPIAPYAKAAPESPINEDDAMRAIEGGWSRVRARAMPAAPEIANLGVAVAAAQVAVEQVLARSGVDTPPHDHKPKGLLNPRAGGKDDLRRIAGLGELDESTLNNLGVYHYDQIAAWTDAEVRWMEGHAFAPGRIAREGWQDQARSLRRAS